MGKYWRNLVYILRHKWFVFLECCRFGMPLVGLVHDLSKFLPDEFFPYARNFFGEKRGCCTSCDEPLDRPYAKPGDERRLGWPKCMNPFCPSFNEPRASVSYRSPKALPEGVREVFDKAWRLHYKRNPHHWEFWLLEQQPLRNQMPDDIAEWRGYHPPITLDMPDRYWKEMIADWRGAGRAQGKPDTNAWYLKNRDRIKLSPTTRHLVETTLGITLQQTVNG